MSDVLLLGITHFPRLRLPDEQWNLLLLKMLSDPAVPEHMKDPARWPAKMREQWGEDRGLRAAGHERRALVADFRVIRSELERFQPDFVVIWGDDQYENFREDGIPPFAILAYERFDVEVRKLQSNQAYNTDEPPETRLVIAGHKDGAKHLAAGLLNKGFDVTYAYQARHFGLSHSFSNSVVYLDQERTGFPWPLVPFAVNCYGRTVICHRAMPKGLSESADPDELDPPSPQPWRCFDLGRACARIAKESPWRIALVASSSWSHAFLTRKHFYLYPDVEADLRLYRDLVGGQYESWRSRTLVEMEECGQQEMLNWMCLAGAMAELKVKPGFANFHESYIFNSPKVFLAAAG
jgi:hypothetical protein